jgi:hypothetical protein
MWCRICYTLQTEIEFFVKSLPSEEDTNGDQGDENRLQPSWGYKIQSPMDFKQAQNGDHLMVPFECDWCIFKKLKGRREHVNLEEDKLLMACIRQINLDAFWSRATSTVKANLEKTRLALRLSASVGLDGPYLQEDFLPAHDHCGYQVAIQMLLDSRRPGKYSNSHSQYDTIR